ncbi:hypothetical protein CFAM422_006287 [Trichoderma lentiforme]|uniref:Uncharacterized protein n=1 Tax=Trichoderma lentiforme TaxID=1567552 RepID=A0A9P4XF92_9HYPO|nr:hypothetical protein CFAM422_006287 [Trichoderma lentiforme]
MALSFKTGQAYVDDDDGDGGGGSDGSDDGGDVNCQMMPMFIMTLDVRMQMEIEAGEKEMGELTLNDDVVGEEKKNPKRAVL